MDLDRRISYEVCGGLLTRQCSLGREIAENPDLWNQHFGPVFIRSMTELAINLGWISCDVDSRSEKFFEFGIGQAKLDYEHSRAGNKEDTPDADYLESEEIFLSTQRYSMFTDVNVGSWSGLSVSKMAEEASLSALGIMFSMASGPVHTSWQFLYDQCLEHLDTDEEPMPFRRVDRIDLSYLLVSASLLDQTMISFDKVSGFTPQDDPLFKLLIEAIDADE